MSDIMDMLDGLLPKDGGDYQCENCGKGRGSIKLTCACGFTIEACAKCYATDRGDVLSAVGQHSGECEEGRHLLRCLS